MTKKNEWVDVKDEEIWYWRPGLTSRLTAKEVCNRLFRRVIRQKKWKLVKLKEDK